MKLVALALVIAACGREPSHVTVGAAASLRHAMPELIEQYRSASGIAIDVTYGASDTLASEVERGAALDALVLADGGELDRLIRTHTITADKSLTERVNLLIGKLERAQVAVYSVVAREDGWAVEKQGAERAVSVHATKDEALESARGVAGRNKPSELVVHRKDGTVQDTIAYEG